MVERTPVEVRCAQLWLGTLVEIRVQASSRAVLDRTVGAAFSVIARVHRTLSAHDPSNELGRVNRDAARVPQRVSPDFSAVLDAALTLAARSRGAFDPTVGARVAAAGFLPRSGPTDPNASWRDVELKNGVVRYRKPLRLDFGGIAKGYAVDCAVHALREHGATAGRVNAGGDLRMFGPSPETVHVRTGGTRSRVFTLAQIADAAVATSAYGDERRRVGRRWATSLIDSRTGLPVMSTRTVSVIADTCMVADALTKVVALRGVAARPLLQDYGAIAAILSPAAHRWRCTLLAPETTQRTVLAA